MNDYIKKAVELADGFSFNDKDAYFSTDELGCMWLDALAAQLVRQVDALGTVTLNIYDRGTEVGKSGQPWATGIAHDRTMNTIKAIVDSGVLE